MRDHINIIPPVDAHAGQKQPEQAKVFLEVVKDRWGSRFDDPDCPTCGPVYETHTSEGKPVEVRIPCPCTARQEVETKRQAEAADRRRRAMAEWRSTCKRLKLTIPAEYADVTLASLDDDPRSLEGKQTILRYLADVEARLADGHGVAFCGETGTGKSTVMAALVNELQARGYRALFLTVGDLLARLRDFGRKDGNGVSRAQEVADIVRDVDFLVLDDLGAESSTTQWAVGELFAVINDRYAARKPFAITSNQSIAGLKPRYVRALLKRMREDDDGGDDRNFQDDAETAWDRIASRIKQRCAVVAYTGDDRRGELRPSWNVG